MTPTAYKQGGKDADIRFAVGQCSLGAILVARSNKGICAITAGRRSRRAGARPSGPLPQRQPDRRRSPDSSGSSPRWSGFVEAPGIGLDLPLDVRGTAFQQRVWQALRGIPAGKTASYAEIARRIGEPEGGARRGAGLRRQHDRGRHSLPPRRAKRRRALRLSLGRGTQARPAREGGQGMNARAKVAPAQPIVRSAEERVGAIRLAGVVDRTQRLRLRGHRQAADAGRMPGDRGALSP